MPHISARRRSSHSVQITSQKRFVRFQIGSIYKNLGIRYIHDSRKIAQHQLNLAGSHVASASSQYRFCVYLQGTRLNLPSFSSHEIHGFLLIGRDHRSRRNYDIVIPTELNHSLSSHTRTPGKPEFLGSKLQIFRGLLRTGKSKSKYIVKFYVGMGHFNRRR
ncbi:hypothetical protein D3C72_1171980 [compost metagenome]